MNVGFNNLLTVLQIVLNLKIINQPDFFFESWIDEDESDDEKRDHVQLKVVGHHHEQDEGLKATTWVGPLETSLKKISIDLNFFSLKFVVHLLVKLEIILF